MLVAAAAVLLLVALGLALPAAIRALHIASLHRLLGRHTWRFIIAADAAAARVKGAGRVGQAVGPEAWTAARAHGAHHGRGAGDPIQWAG